MLIYLHLFLDDDDDFYLVSFSIIPQADSWLELACFARLMTITHQAGGWSVVVVAAVMAACSWSW